VPVCGFLLVAILLAWIGRLDVSRWVAIWLLDRSGVGPTSLTVDAVDLAGIHVRKISLFGGAVRAEALTLSYDPVQLVSGGINQATITRPRVTLALTDDGVEIGGVPLGAPNAPGGASFLDGIRIDAIRIVDAQITVAGPSGPVEAAFSTDLVVGGTEVGGSGLVADLVIPVADGTQAVHVVVPTFAVSLSDGGVRLRFAGVATIPQGLPWAADALAGEVSWQSGRMAATVTTGRITSTGDPVVIRPVDLTAEATMAGPRVEFALHGTVRPPSGAGVMRLDAIGHHDRATGKGQSRISVGPVVFGAGSRRPEGLFPILAGALPDLSGSVALSGVISWDGTTIAPGLVLRLSDGVYEPKGVRLSAIRSDLAISGLWPLATPRNQTITATVEAGGLPAMQAELAFQILPKPALRVDAIGVDLLGGRISTSPFVVDPARPVVETRIELRQVDLGEFFKLVGVDGLGGSGRLDGTIPLTLHPGVVDIRDGHLAASGPGVIRLDGGVLPPQITDAGESMILVLQALTDFHYDSLTIDVDGRATGQGTVVLKLTGNNPNLLDGRPFHINIRFESNFDRLVEIALRSMEAAQALLRRTTGSARR